MLFECSLHGRISDQIQSQLIDRLIGVCATEPVPVSEHEIGFVPTVQIRGGPGRNEDVLLRLKSSLDDKDLTKRKWQLIQIGPPETSTQKPVTVRQINNSSLTNGNTFAFMTALGYSFAFEFIRRGVIFVYRNILKIVITQIFLPEVRNDATRIKPFDPNNHWLVEVSALAESSERVEAVVDELKVFAAMLKGTVDLHLVDHLILQNRVF